MRFQHSDSGKPLLPITLSLGEKSLAVDAGQWRGRECVALASRRVARRPMERTQNNAAAGRALAGTDAMPLLMASRVAGFQPVRLAFAWCRTDDVPLVLGQTNFFMEFDICFFRARHEFSVVPKGSGNA